MATTFTMPAMSTTRPAVPADARARWLLYGFFTVLSTCVYLLFASVQNDRLEARSGDSVIYQGIVLLLYLALIASLPLATILRDKGPSVVVVATLFLTSIVGYLTAGSFGTEYVKLGLFMGTLVVGVWAATVFPVDAFFDQFLRFAAIVVVGHLLAYPVFSSLAAFFDQIERPNMLGLAAYAGIFAHKNLAGVFFGLASIVGLASAFKRTGRGAWRWHAATALCVFALLMTGAVAPLLALIVATVALLVIGTTARSHGLGTVTVIAAAAMTIAIVMFYADVLDFFGRDTNLTGRTMLYEQWPEFFGRYPIFGYGFSHFFANPKGGFGWELQFTVDPRVWHEYYTFESGYLQFAIEFGGLGLLLLLAAIARSLQVGVSHALHGRGTYAYCPLAVALFIAISSLSDTYLTIQNTLYPALLMYVFSLAPVRAAEGGERVGEPADVVPVSVRPGMPLSRAARRDAVRQATEAAQRRLRQRLER